MHFHYALFAEILQDLAKTVSALPLADEAHRTALGDAAKALYLALANRPTDDGSKSPAKDKDGAAAGSEVVASAKPPERRC